MTRTLRRAHFRYRTVRSEGGGVTQHGPFQVRFPMFGFRLIYAEQEKKLTVPVEIGQDGEVSVGTAFIRNWEESSGEFSKEDAWKIAENIFAALEVMGVQVGNVR